MIEMALDEDLGKKRVDLTATALHGATAQANVVFRAAGVICGLQIAERIASRFPSISLKLVGQDGDFVEAGTIIARISGEASTMMTLERTLLNFIGHLSGVATLTRRFVSAAEIALLNTDTQAAPAAVMILDTRKTMPGYRLLEKFAVRCGGGTNHRMGLWDEAMIKDNHIDSVGMSEATARVRSAHPEVRITIEARTSDEVRQAIACRANVIMLDNMSPSEMATCVAMVRKENARTRRCEQIRDEDHSDEHVRYEDRHAEQLTEPADLADNAILTEASGGVTLDSIGTIARTGVDRISVGAITHSAPFHDVAMDVILG